MQQVSDKQWTNKILHRALLMHNVRCIDQTPSSAQYLVSRGQIAAEDFIESSPEIERNLMEAFIDDDFEGKLHLTSLLALKKRDCVDEDLNRLGGNSDEEVVGLAFWREVPSDEMAHWLDMCRIYERLARSRNNQEITYDEDFSSRGRRALELARHDSISWIKNALIVAENEGKCIDDCGGLNGDDNIGGMKNSTLSSTLQNLIHSWVKIELIAIKQSYRAHHLGNILLGCTLTRANAMHSNQHAVLHVAGGGAIKNVAAARLYSRFGFVEVARHEDGGPFSKPDKDLFVLGNIGKTLNKLPWKEMI